MTENPTITAVVATLRQVAGWGLSFESGPAREELLEIAREVETLAESDGLCCPVCDEVDCDNDCPLAAVRARPSNLQPTDDTEGRVPDEPTR
ncbi:MAG: hypothetical protein ABWY93_18720 [Mycobacterium sp.]